jgi:peptidoglycan/xylan/chitin deacetylase (PgdA/CDA1 family)
MVGSIIKSIGKKAIEISAPQRMQRFYTQHGKNSTFWGKYSCAVSISADCDLTEDTKAIPKMLDILNSHDIKASFACVGKQIEKNSKPYQNILDNGHEIINHTYTHPNNEEFSPDRFFNKLNMQEKTNEVMEFEKICKKNLGYKARGFRTPHFGNLHSTDVYNILNELGYEYSTSTCDLKSGQAVPFLVEGIVELPVSVCPLHPYTAFGSWHFFRSHYHKKENDFKVLFEKRLNQAIDTHTYFNVIIDPQDFKHTENTLELLHDRKIWVARTGDVAKWFKRK